jgi:hypothetical protein
MLRMVAAVVCVIFLFSLVLIPFANADWIMFHTDPSHSGAGTSNPMLTPATSLPSGSSLAGTTSQVGFNLDTESCTFYADGYYYVFYDDGANYVYSSCASGSSSWSSPTVLGSDVNSYYSYSAVWNGFNIAYMREDSGQLGLYFREGTPDGSGSVTWLTDEQTVVSTSRSCLDPSIAFDTAGYPYITYSANGGNFEVIKSSLNNGTWATASGYPVTLETISGTMYPYGAIVPLTGGKMGVVWCVQYTAPSAQALYYSIYNGNVWSPLSSFTTNNPEVIGSYNLIPFCVDSSGDNMFVAFVDSSGNLRFNSYAYSSGWGTEATVVSGLANVTFPSISVAGSDLFLFYNGSPNNDAVSYIEYNGYSWDSAQTLFSDVSETLNPESLGVSGIYAMIGAFQHSDNSVVGLVYVAGSASPFDVEFTSLDISSPLPTPTPTPTPTTPTPTPTTPTPTPTTPTPTPTTPTPTPTTPTPTPAASPSLTAPEFPDQVLIITLVVSMTIASSVIIIVKKRLAWKTQRA